MLSAQSKKIFATAATAAAALVLYTNLTTPNHKHNHQATSTVIRSGVFDVGQNNTVNVGQTRVTYRVDDTSLNPVEINQLLQKASLSGVSKTIHSSSISDIQKNPQQFANDVRLSIQKDIDGRFFNVLQVKKGVAPLVIEEVVMPNICLKLDQQNECIGQVSSAAQNVKNAILQLRDISRPPKSSMTFD